MSLLGISALGRARKFVTAIDSKSHGITKKLEWLVFLQIKTQREARLFYFQTITAIVTTINNSVPNDGVLFLKDVIYYPKCIWLYANAVS